MSTFNSDTEGKLRSACLEMTGEEPDSTATACMLAYIEQLIRWNKTYNLTAIRDPEEMITRHLLDSLSVLPWIKTGSLLDAGTGAGLPGLVLAIMRPEMKVTLLDSAGKKIRFLRHVKRELGLDNVQLAEQRLENFQPDQLPNVIISRAFASLIQFASAARHLMAPGGRLYAMKGQYPEAEIAALEDWAELRSVQKIDIPGLHEQRHLVMMSVRTLTGSSEPCLLPQTY